MRYDDDRRAQASRMGLCRLLPPDGTSRTCGLTQQGVKFRLRITGGVS